MKINYLCICLQKLESKQQIKLKENNKVNKVKAEENKGRQVNLQQVKVSKTTNLFFKKTKNVDKYMARLRKEKKKEEKAELINIGNENEDIITEATNFKNIRKKFTYKYIPINFKIYMIWKNFQENILSKFYKRSFKI